MKQLVWVLVFLMLLTLTACAKNDDQQSTNTGKQPDTPTEIATAILSALNDRDFSRAKHYFCDKDRIALDANPPIASAPQYGNVQCVEADGGVVCSYDIMINRRIQKAGESVRFDIVDDNTLCIAE